MRRHRWDNYTYPLFLSLLLSFGLGGCNRSRTSQEQATVRIAVPSTPINFLPIYLARELGYYQEAGVNVIVEDVAGGSKALQSMLGGSADIAASFFENVLELAVEGRKIQSFLTLLNRPGFVLAVSPVSARSITSLRELKGAVIGVTTPGSASHHFVNYLLLRNNVRLQDVSITSIGLGATSVAAFERGKINAGVLTGNGATIVQRHFPNLKVLADTRRAEGVKRLFGSEIYPANDLIASTEWLRRNDVFARKVAESVLRAMHWMSQHSPEEIRDKMPAQYRAGDRAADLDAIRETIPMLSPDGRLSEVGAEVVRTALAASSERVRSASINLTKTYTNEFIAPPR